MLDTVMSSFEQFLGQRLIAELAYRLVRNGIDAEQFCAIVEAGENPLDQLSASPNMRYKAGNREGQINQFQYAQKKLHKVRQKLSRMGMDTNHIDDQLSRVNAALDHRLSATGNFHGAIIRIDQEQNGETIYWKLTARNGEQFYIPMNATEGITKIPAMWQKFPSAEKPMTKFLEYKTEMVGSQKMNIITYAENRTVDIVPIRTQGEHSQYYLIKRRKSGLWATPGGHIDEGELSNPINAARRELREETGAHPLYIQQLPGGWLKEEVAHPDQWAAVEYHSWTMPFIAIVQPDFQMTPGDDAADGQWFDPGHSPDDFHFTHHKQILSMAFEYLPQLMAKFGKK